MSNDLDSVEIDTKAHYLKESAKELMTEDDYYKAAKTVLSDFRLFSEVYPDVSEKTRTVMFGFANASDFLDPAYLGDMYMAIFDDVYVHVGGEI